MIPNASAADALFVKVKRAMGGLRVFGGNDADGVRQEPADSKWNINNVTVRLPSLDSILNMAAFSLSPCLYVPTAAASFILLGSLDVSRNCIQNLQGAQKKEDNA